MKTGLYSVYDKKAGIFGSPFVSVNDRTAERDFVSLINKNPELSVISEDLDLYYVGSIETLSGEISLPESGKPNFIFNLVKELSNG